MQPSQVWIGMGALALAATHLPYLWLPCSSFSKPPTLSAHKQPLPSSRLNGGCYGNFGRHKSPAARRSEESRKSTLFVSTRAGGECTVVVTRGRRRRSGLGAGQHCAGLRLGLCKDTVQWGKIHQMQSVCAYNSCDLRKHTGYKWGFD